MLHHYTSINSLALILESQKIRFTKLNCLDDLKEAENHSPLKFSNIIFASCWTEDTTESIPLWKMYTPNCRGVRIGIKGEIFPKFEIKASEHLSITQEGKNIRSMMVYFPFDNLVHGDIMIHPLSNYDDFFKGPITYVDNVMEKWNEQWKGFKFHDDGGFSFEFGKPLQLFRLKNKPWQFQSEYRFQLLLTPSIKGEQIPIGPALNEDPTNILTDCLLKRRTLKIDYFDIPFSSDVYENLEITLGPTTDRSERLIVESLISKYAPNASIMESALSGHIRK